METRDIPSLHVPSPLILPDNVHITPPILQNVSKTVPVPAKKQALPKLPALPARSWRQLVPLTPITKNANATLVPDMTIPMRRQQLRAMFPTGAAQAVSKPNTSARKTPAPATAPANAAAKPALLPVTPDLPKNSAPAKNAAMILARTGPVKIIPVRRPAKLNAAIAVINATALVRAAAAPLTAERLLPTMNVDRPAENAAKIVPPE